LLNAIFIKEREEAAKLFGGEAGQKLQVSA